MSSEHIRLAIETLHRAGAPPLLVDALRAWFGARDRRLAILACAGAAPSDKTAPP